jgi:hypothetical protein
VRALLLAITGTLSISYCKSRDCMICGSKFSFEHFLSCPLLGPCVGPSVSAFIDARDWLGTARLLLSRFEVFVHATRGGEMSDEETDLFGALTLDED